MSRTIFNLMKAIKGLLLLTETISATVQNDSNKGKCQHWSLVYTNSLYFLGLFTESKCIHIA